MTAPESAVSRSSHQAMGTHFEVLVANEDAAYAGQAAAAIFAEIDRIERLFSRFNPSSEISQVNRLKPGESLPIGFETFDCLNIAECVCRETGGAFDVNVRSRDQKPEFGNRTPAGSSPSFGLLQTAAGYEIRAGPAESRGTHPFALDLGAIGKGYALDRAVELLKDWGIDKALVHGGTSTAIALGSGPDNRGWPVGVGGGWPGAPREMLLSGRALSGSGTEVKGRHIIDPRTGAPAEGHLAAWAVHPSAAVADALSTAFMVMTTEDVEAYCRRHPDVWALVIPSYGESFVFPAILLP